MKLDTARIRALNDELRHNLPNAHAVITAGVAALGPDAVPKSFRPSRSTMTFVTSTIPMKNTTSAHSKSKAM